MKYADILSKYIKNSGLSLREIARRVKLENVRIDSSYISKLQSGQAAPPSEELSTALASVTGGDPTELILSGYMERAPKEVRDLLSKIVDYDSFFKVLLQYIDFDVLVESDEEKTLEFKKSHDIINSPEFFNNLDPQIRHLWIQGALEGLMNDNPEKYHQLTEALKSQVSTEEFSAINISKFGFNSDFSLEVVALPVVGSISCGEGIIAYEDIQEILCVPKEWANGAEHFFLRAKGDSMIGARIQEGDLLLIRRQDDIEDGEIGAVIVDDEAFLKRVFKRGSSIVLQSENPNYGPLVFDNDQSHHVLIVGKLKKVIIDP